MSADPNKKSARTFQCRDVLWETFEQMARELECSIDYLINESMKQYARQRSYSPRTPFPGQARMDGGPPSMPMPTGQQAATGAAPPPMPGGPPPPPPGFALWAMGAVVAHRPGRDHPRGLGPGTECADCSCVAARTASSTR